MFESLIYKNLLLVFFNSNVSRETVWNVVRYFDQQLFLCVSRET